VKLTASPVPWLSLEGVYVVGKNSACVVILFD